MKKLLYIATTFVAICSGIVGCQDNDGLLSDNIRKSSHANSQTITVEEAKRQAIGFVNNLAMSTRSDAEKEIGDVYVWRKDQIYRMTRSSETMASLPDTMMYIVNFKNNGGYMLVSASTNCRGVFAYVESGYMSPYDEINNPGFNVFLENAGRLMAYGETNPPDTSGIGNQFTEDSLPPSERLYFVGNPLLTTKWRQNSPFNDECPIVNNTHCKAGCAPVATAQVVAFHRYPDSYYGHTYNWNEILDAFTPTSATGKSSAAHLVHDIGVKEEADYGITATSVYPSKIRSCLLALGYWCSTLSDYSYSRCRQNFNRRRPVIINGYRADNSAGHTWVLDGGFSWREEYNIMLPNGTYQTIVNVEDFVHCNWGWGGSQNGYYWSEVFDVCYKQYEDDVFDELNIIEWEGYDFSYNLSVCYDIFPIHLD